MVSEKSRRAARRFSILGFEDGKKHDVLIIFGNGDLPFDRIVEFEFVLRIAERFETDDERLPPVGFFVKLLAESAPETLEFMDETGV